MITVLTPTYNRAATLIRAFESLRQQSDARFEWLVVDDGSTDGTGELLRELATEAPFALRTLAQANGGKHRALNAGARESRGNWVLILDSDDALTPDAVAVVHAELEAHAGADVLGLCFRRCRFDGTLIGRRNEDAAPVAMHPTEASEYFKGDLAYVFRREALAARPFPTIAGENFFPELYVWNRIGDDGRIVYFPQLAIYRCEYLADGYTARFRRNLRRNPRGFGTYYRDQIGRERTLMRKLKCAARALQCEVTHVLRKVGL